MTWRVENWDVAGKDTSPGTSGDRQTVVEGSVARRRVLLEREAVVVVVNAFVRVVVVVVVVVAACFAIELCWTYVVVVVAAAVVVVQVLRVVWGSHLCWMKTAAAEMNSVFFVVAAVVVVVDIDGMKTCRAAFETDSISTLTKDRTTTGNPRPPQTSVLGWRSVAAAGKEPDPGWQGIPSSAAGTWPRGLT